MAEAAKPALASLRCPLLSQDESRAHRAASSALQRNSGAKTHAWVSDKHNAIAGLQRWLVEYCRHAGGEVEPVATVKPRRILCAHMSDPVDYRTPSWPVVADNNTGGRWLESLCGPSATPGRFRRHFIQLGQHRLGSNNVFDFILDVAFDVQEHYERMAQRCILPLVPLPSQQSRSSNSCSTTMFGTQGVKRRSPPRKSSDVATVLVILKSFTGGTLLVVPAGFQQAGLLSGHMIFWGAGLLQLLCMMKLLETHRMWGGSFSQLAGRAIGRAGAVAVDVSVVLAQLGFVITEMIYVAQNGSFALRNTIARFPGLAALLPRAATTGSCDLVVALLWTQLLIVVPAAWHRELTALTAFNLVGNLLVIITLFMLSATTFRGLARSGIAEDVRFVSSLPDCLAFLGVAVFTFDGINMVIPMYTAHRNKASFKRILLWTIIGIIALFSAFGGASTLLYGADVQPILTLNLPQDSMTADWVPLGFAMASLCLVPLMAFPTYEILEGLAQWSGFGAHLVSSHHRVNAFRSGLLIMCCIVAHTFKAQLHDFLALTGAIGCVPLAFVYPSVIHLKLMARSPAQVVGDCLCLTLGFSIAVLCTVSILSSS